MLLASSIIEGERLDTGDPAGLLDAILRYAETRPELRAALERHLRQR